MRYGGLEAGFIRIPTRTQWRNAYSIDESHPSPIPFASRIRGYRPLGGLNGLGCLFSCVGVQPPARTFPLPMVLRGGHPIGCREAHYLFPWTFGEIPDPR